MTAGLLVLLTLVIAPPAADQSAIAGTWTVDTDVQGNTGSQTCTFALEKTVLSGTCEGLDKTPLALTGEATDADVTWKYDIVWEGQALTLVFRGALSSDTAMKGTIDVQPMSVPGAFSAAKKPAVR